MFGGCDLMFESWRLRALNISAVFVDYYYTRDSSINSLSEISSQIWFPLAQKYHYWMSLADRRVENWPWMSSPWPTLAIIIMYLYLCLRGPQYMENRKGFTKLKPLILAYNLVTVLLNLYIALELFITLRTREEDFYWTCESVDYSYKESAVRIANALWWYYASKCFEMLDSVFFILRKKEEQLTFLHIYHHSTMFGLWWIGVKFVAGGSAFPGAMLNASVHVIMYIYYFIAALGPTYRRWLWWKKYLTILQLAQFTAALVFATKAVIEGDCDFPLWMQYTLIGYMISFLILFSKYFTNEYLSCQRQKERKHIIKNGQARN